MKKTFIGLLFVGMMTSVAWAHPPVSIVMDSQGNVYFSDLERVWKIGRDGEKTVVVDGVHTHELWMSGDDVLYGEDVTNIGELYRHRVWKRYPDGRVENDIDWREGYPTKYNDYGFVKDEKGLLYLLERDKREIQVVDAGNVVRVLDLSRHKGYLHWHTVHADGTVYITIGDALIRFKPAEDTGEVIATDLIERTAVFSFLHDRHALMGLWTDDEGGVFVSVFSGQRVKYIAPDGSIQSIYRQRGQWSTVGGLVDKAGAHWLLEFSVTNKVRVRKIDGSKEWVY